MKTLLAILLGVASAQLVACKTTDTAEVQADAISLDVTGMT